MLYCNQKVAISVIVEFYLNMFQKGISPCSLNATHPICALPSTDDCVHFSVIGKVASTCVAPICVTCPSASHSVQCSRPRASPPPLALLLPPAKRIFEVCKLRGRSRQKIYANNVEAHLHGGPARELPHVLSCHAAQHVAFVFVDRGLGWRHIVRRPRLHLDEAKQRASPRNQIQIAWQISARPPMRHDNIVLALQVRTGCILAFDSCR